MAGQQFINLMPTIKRSDKGIEMKGAATPVRVSQQPATTVLDEDPDEPNTQSSVRFREKCEVVKAPTPDPEDKTICGMEWTPMDKDHDGNARCYVCENRAMKIAANMRRERRESISSGTEWVLFRMGALIFRSTDLKEVFEYAANN